METVLVKMLVLGVAAAVLAGAAHAQTGPTDRVLNPFSDCGLGAAIITDPSMGWLAATSNVTWDLGTTAVISALSSPNTCTGGRAQTAQYITSTYASLEAETAAGEGKYLEGLATVMACTAEIRPVLFQRVRASLAPVMAAPGFAELDRMKKSEAYFKVVDGLAQSEFASDCSMT